jgi:hypothetical protein
MSNKNKNGNPPGFDTQILRAETRMEQAEKDGILVLDEEQPCGRVFK